MTSTPSSWGDEEAREAGGRGAAVARVIDWVLAGPRREAFQKLLSNARRQGYATFREVRLALQEAEEDLDLLDEVFRFLEAHGISVTDDGDDAPKTASRRATIEQEREPRRSDLLQDIPVDDTISLYFREMSQEPLLSRQQEIELAQRIERGIVAQRRLSAPGVPSEERAELWAHAQAGLEARDQLVRANTRLVVSIAKRYRNRGVPFLDLIQEGNLGLMKAVEKFDYRRGNKFGTYATWWIRQSVARAVPAQGRTVRLPISVMQRIRRVYKESARLEQRLGRRPTLEELAEELEVEPLRVLRTMESSYFPISLEKPVGEDGDSMLGDFIADEGVQSPDIPVERTVLAQRLEQLLETLKPREARILRLRFGLLDGHCRTLKEIGEMYGLSKERIRQIQYHALWRLRHPRCLRQLRDHM
jgi:RNA polymerase primary sigma factor